MFGLWRLLLAIEVVAYHLLLVPIIGQYAVFSFFVLSGFLMTAIMRGTYGYTANGMLRYAQNRLLRLFPNYWFAIAISLFVIAWLGESTVAAYNDAMTLPRSTGQWAENLTMVFAGFFPKAQSPRLSPPTWALTVELCFYLLIGLGVSRTGRSIAIWLALSIAYFVGVALTHHHDEYYYSAIPAGSLPFAAGAATFHMRDRLHTAIRRARLDDGRLLIALRWLLYLLVLGVHAAMAWGWFITFGNLINIALSSLIVCTLYFARPGERWRRRDRAAGDLSYPTYLLHWQMGAVASQLLLGQLVFGFSPQGAIAFAGALILTLAAGSVCARLIDPAIERVRARIRCATGANRARRYGDPP